MAKAIVAAAFGGPEVLSLTDVEVGTPGPGQVLIEVRAAGVNPIDFKIYRAGPTNDPSRLPLRLGFEAAGVVQMVGGGAGTIDGFDGPLAVGDEVIAYPAAGAYATEILAPAANVVHKPAGIDFPQASGLLLTGATAVHALEVAKVGAGDTVLVHGASGGVGLMAIQLAVASGARVIGTAAERHHEQLRKLGVEPVAYGEGLVERVRALAPGGVDASIDIAGTEESVQTSLAVARDRDRLVTVVNSQEARDAGIKAIGGGPGADPGTEVRSAARLRLTRLAGQGELEVFMAGTYPLAQAAAAHEALMAGRAHGKIALIP